MRAVKSSILPMHISGWLFILQILFGYNGKLRLLQTRDGLSFFDMTFLGQNRSFSLLSKSGKFLIDEIGGTALHSPSTQAWFRTTDRGAKHIFYGFKWSVNGQCIHASISTFGYNLHRVAFNRFENYRKKADCQIISKNERTLWGCPWISNNEASESAFLWNR